MMPADAVNPLYASLGTLPGFHTTYSPVLMPAVPTTMAGHPHLSEPVTAKTGEISAEKAAKDLPFLMPPVYDHLTPKSLRDLYSGDNFTESSKVRKAATFLKGNALQWWTSLLMQGLAPTTWIQFKRHFSFAWLQILLK